MATHRKALLMDLENSLSSCTEQADLCDTQYKQSKKIIEQLKSGQFIVLLKMLYCQSLNLAHICCSKQNKGIRYLQILSLGKRSLVKGLFT